MIDLADVVATLEEVTTMVETGDTKLIEAAKRFHKLFGNRWLAKEDPNRVSIFAHASDGRSKNDIEELMHRLVDNII